jgi:hypothetical protein
MYIYLINSLISPNWRFSLLSIKLVNFYASTLEFKINDKNLKLFHPILIVQLIIYTLLVKQSLNQMHWHFYY